MRDFSNKSLCHILGRYKNNIPWAVVFFYMRIAEKKWELLKASIYDDLLYFTSDICKRAMHFPITFDIFGNAWSLVMAYIDQ